MEPVLLASRRRRVRLRGSRLDRGLELARAVIGLGVSVCLMAPLKAIAVWYPADRQASYAGWMMVAGGVGAIVAIRN